MWKWRARKEQGSLDSNSGEPIPLCYVVSLLILFELFTKQLYQFSNLQKNSWQKVEDIL